MVAASTRWTLHLQYVTESGNQKWLRLDGGELAVYWSGPTPDAAPGDDPPVYGFSSSAEHRWDDSISLAWRPYHIGIRHGFSFSDPYGGFAFPLWLIALPAVIAAAYTHGMVVGVRRGDRGRCGVCGYSRAGLAADAPCPECGKKG
jgi:hypothetical protein